MKIKALTATEKGYNQFLKQSKEDLPEDLKVNFDDQVNKIIECNLYF